MNSNHTREPLPGTVKYFGRHLFLCTGRTTWPAHIEDSGGFIAALAQQATAAEAAMSGPVKISACDVPSRGQGMDVMVFPDQVRYLGLTLDDIPGLVNDHLIGGAITTVLDHEPLTGHHVFVCGHGERDRRCGECGPPLLAALKAALAAAGLQSTVHAHLTSHVGGHAYAGLVLIYPEGDWYGYVTPTDLPDLIDHHLIKGRVLWDRWRGRMGLTSEAAVQMAAAHTPPGNPPPTH